LSIDLALWAAGDVVELSVHHGLTVDDRQMEAVPDPNVAEVVVKGGGLDEGLACGEDSMIDLGPAGRRGAPVITGSRELSVGQVARHCRCGVVGRRGRRTGRRAIMTSTSWIGLRRRRY
jgi:hypothetical protein